MGRKLFPLGKAHGAAFCNRVTETKELLSHFESQKHILLIAPRRYGKSSLAERAIRKSKFSSATINFHLATSEKEVAELITTAVTKLISQNFRSIESIIPKIKKALKTLHPKISFFGDTATLELIPAQETNYAVTIAESMLLLDQLLLEKGQQAVLFLDEFQEITKLKNNESIEGGIRTAAQDTSALSIIFSGSIRSLLLQMFEEEHRPLYKLCRKIHLRRISATDYKKHIQKIAKATWGEELSQNTMGKILTISNRHPYYINYLCDTVWQQNKKLPTEKSIQTAWQQVVSEEWSDAVHEISELPMSQRRLMRFIALKGGKQITSKEATTQLEMAASSAMSSLTALVEKDYVTRINEGQYQIINPLLKTVISE